MHIYKPYIHTDFDIIKWWNITRLQITGLFLGWVQDDIYEQISESKNELYCMLHTIHMLVRNICFTNEISEPEIFKFVFFLLSV